MGGVEVQCCLMIVILVVCDVVLVSSVLLAVSELHHIVKVDSAVHDVVAVRRVLLVSM